MDYISRQKQWEAEQARMAEESTAVPEDDEMDTAASTGQSSGMPRFWDGFSARADDGEDTDAVEQVLSQEDQELEALVSLMEAEGKVSQDHVPSPTEYGSDDEDYNDIFKEVLNGSDAQLRADGARNQTEQDQEMDTSNG